MTAGAEADKVLTTDASGVASWQTAGGGWDGILPNYTTPQRNELSLTDGLIVYNTTENAVQIYASGVWKNVGAKGADGSICNSDGDCDSTHCVDGVCCDFECSGTVCQTCGALSSAGIGKCGYVNNSSNDPRDDCTTGSPGATDSCKDPNCSGTGYTCGYLSSGEQGQPTCKTCSGSSYDPSNIAQGVYDTEGTNLCTAEHYRCDGNGDCTAPMTRSCVGMYCNKSTSKFSELCALLVPSMPICAGGAHRVYIGEEYHCEPVERTCAESCTGWTYFAMYCGYYNYD